MAWSERTYTRPSTSAGVAKHVPSNVLVSATLHSAPGLIVLIVQPSLIVNTLPSPPTGDAQYLPIASLSRPTR